MNRYRAAAAVPALVVLLSLIAIATSQAQQASGTFLLGTQAIDVAAAPGSAPVSRALSVASSGAPLPYAAKAGYLSVESGWLSVTPSSGVTPATLEISFEPQALAPGMYMGYVEIDSGGSQPPVFITATLHVGYSGVIDAGIAPASRPQRVASWTFPRSLNFYHQIGTPAPKPGMLAITGKGFPLGYSAETADSWISLGRKSDAASPALSGVAPESLTVNVDPSGLAPGTYSGSVGITGVDGTEESIPVSLTISSDPLLVAEPGIVVLPSSSTTPAAITVRSTGAELTYAAAADPSSGLSIGPAAGSTAGANQIFVAADASTGTASDASSISIRSAATPNALRVPVIRPTPAATGLSADPPSVNLQGTFGGAAKSQNVTISGGTAQSFTVTVFSETAIDWVTVAPTSGTTPATIKVTVDPGKVGIPGTNSTKLLVSTATGDLLFIDVVFAVGTASTITASPTSLSFSQMLGGNAPDPQSLHLTASPAASVSISSNRSWMTVFPASANTPADVAVAVFSAGLSQGTYSGSLTISGGASPVTVPVTFTITKSNVTLTPTPASLSFSGNVGGSAPASQTLKVDGAPGGTSFTASAGLPWLTVTPQSGTMPANLTATVNTTGVTAGTYQTSITVTSGGATATIPVTITLGAATLGATPFSLSFSQSLGGAAPDGQTFKVDGLAAGTAFTVTSNVNWLTLTPTSGTMPANVTVAANGSSLPAGAYQGTISVTAGSSTATVAVTLSVSTNALTVTPASLSFAQTFGGDVPAAKSLRVDSTVSGTAFTATSSPNWVTLSSSSGKTPATLNISANSAGFPVGTYQASITITTSTASQSIPVMLIVSNSNATITVAPQSLSLSHVLGGSVSPPAQIFVNSPNAATPFIATSDSSWLSVTPSSGRTPAPLSVSLNVVDLAAGTYQGVITISGGTAPVSLPVTLTVTATAPAPAVSPQSLSFSQALGGAAPASQIVHIDSSAASASVAATSSAQWLTASLSATTTPANLTVSVNTAGMAAGTYQGSIALTVGPSTASVPVTLTVSSGTGAGSLTATPQSLTFAQVLGGNAPNPQKIHVDSAAAGASVTLSTTSPWLAITPSTATAPADFTVLANASGLAAGTYQGTIAITAGTNTTSVAVTLTVTSGSGSTISAVQPSSLSFTGQVNGTAPASQTINITSSAAQFTFTVTAATTDHGAWLNATPASGTTPANLTVTCSLAGLAAGQYTGAVTITPADTTIPPQIIPVTLAVAASGGSGSGAPFVRSILSSASLQPSPVSPGEIISLMGSGLGPATGVGAQMLPAGAIDSTVAGTRVLFDGIPAPLLYVRSDQINAIVPYGIYGRAGVLFQVEVSGVKSDPLNLRVADAAPAVFTSDHTGTGQAAIINQDGTMNSPVFPAPRGSVVSIYGTGEGQTNPGGQDGRIITTDLRSPRAAVSVKIGGVPAQVKYAGSAPGLVSGVLQVNVEVPANIPPGGQVPIELTIGGIASQSGVTLAVR